MGVFRQGRSIHLTAQGNLDATERRHGGGAGEDLHGRDARVDEGSGAMNKSR